MLQQDTTYWVAKQQNEFLTGLGSGKLKVRMPADSMCGEELSWFADPLAPLLFPHMAE